jgi:hypothetical protein
VANPTILRDSYFETESELQRTLSQKSEEVIYQQQDNSWKSGAYSFSDCKVTAILPWFPKKELSIIDLAPIQLLAYSEHRPNFIVTSAGYDQVRGMTSGHKTTAGSMGFVSGVRSPFMPIIGRFASLITGTPETGQNIGVLDIPPINLSVTFSNEWGDVSHLFIRAIKFADSSAAIDVNTPFIPNSYSFIAHSVTTLEAFGVSR